MKQQKNSCSVSVQTIILFLAFLHRASVIPPLPIMEWNNFAWTLAVFAIGIMTYEYCVSVVMKQPPIVRYPKLADDLKLGQRYKSAMQRIMRESEK